MPYAESNGVRLYYEEAGRGVPIVFVHEYSGDLWSWESQIQHFSRRYRCIAFNARGYPPSDVPASVAKYSQRIAVDDVAAVMRHLGIRNAHIMGCSMGSQSTLYFGLTYPRMAMSLTLIGIGTGSDPRNQAAFRRETEAKARLFEKGGLSAVLATVKRAPNRIQLKQKNPRAFENFCKKFMRHSAQGCANIARGVQASRPPLQSLERKLRALTVPTHVIVGDEDPGAVAAGVYIKQVCAAARLTVAPATGHLVNLEEPELVNRLSEDFYALIESRRWRPRQA
jgi:pimeloyl-ACP methyl ester carboxylesterase